MDDVADAYTHHKPDAFIEGPGGVAPRADLRPEHRAYLDARAVPLDYAVERGLRSIEGNEACRLLGLGSVPSGGLLIPYPNDRGYYRLRLDQEADARFLCPKGRPVPVFVAGESAYDRGCELYVVEGPIKALALAARGLAAVGLGGVNTTLADDELNSSWDALHIEGREVVIVFDAGRATNPRVAEAEAALALALEHAGASVRVATLPLRAKRQDQGPDDFVAANGWDAFLRVLAQAHPASPENHLEALLGRSEEE